MLNVKVYRFKKNGWNTYWGWDDEATSKVENAWNKFEGHNQMEGVKNKRDVSCKVKNYGCAFGSMHKCI